MGNETRSDGVFLAQWLTTVGEVKVCHIGGTTEETQVDVADRGLAARQLGQGFVDLFGKEAREHEVRYDEKNTDEGKDGTQNDEGCFRSFFHNS